MNRPTDERLYNLLPAIYRIRDVAEGEPLRALLSIIQKEMDLIEQDIDGLYDDWFIETAAEWVVPYIGELLGVRDLHSIESAELFSQRASVANTLPRRRRKGTGPVLEQLARDVTGWPARAVEFFERLITNQHLNHLRPHNRTTVDLRAGNALELLNGPFETAAHTVEVRRIATERGKYNIPNIGLFLWRLQSYFVTQSAPRPVAEIDDGRYRFSPLGNDIPLFNRPQTETEITHLAEEINVPGRLRRRALYDEFHQTSGQSRFLDNNSPAFQIFKDDGGELIEIPTENILICDLSDAPGGTGWHRPSTPDQVAVDPELGRLAFAKGAVPARVAVSYAYGFSSDIGGGPYGRQETVIVAISADIWTAEVGQGGSATHTTLASALAEWDGSSDAIITILDSAIYTEGISITLNDGANLVIQAADGQRPTLRLLTGTEPLGVLTIEGTAGTEAMLTLNGLWIEGSIYVSNNVLGALKIEHCTLVPGLGLDVLSQPLHPEQPSIVAESSAVDLQVTIRRSITGPLYLPEEIDALVVADSIIDSPQRERPALASGEEGEEVGPKTTLERVTMLGSANVCEFDIVSETIFTQPAVAQRKQIGCTRFSFLPAGSQMPRRFRCQPDLALVQATQEMGLSHQESILSRVKPTFTSLRYGDPAYGQLSQTCAGEIRTGAEDGSEMGVFQHLKQSQREANLRASLTEYLRFGLEAGIFFVT